MKKQEKKVLCEFLIRYCYQNKLQSIYFCLIRYVTLIEFLNKDGNINKSKYMLN